VADPDRATCPRCGGPLPAQGPAGVCPRCLLSHTQGGESEDPPVSPSSPGGASGRVTLVSLVLAIGRVLRQRLWSGTKRGQQPSDAKALLSLGNALSDQGR